MEINFENPKMHRGQHHDRYASDEPEYSGPERRRENLYFYADQHDRQISFTLKELVTIAGIVAAIAGAWIDVNRSIDSQRITSENFQQQVVREMAALKLELSEAKKVHIESDAVIKKDLDDLGKRVQDLDGSLSQMYQQLSNKPSRK